MERDTIEKAYRMYAGEAYLYSLALCKNRDIAEDIVSEAFVKALLAISAGEENFKLWLLRVCKTTWFDMCRRNRFISALSIDGYTALQSEDDILQSIISRETRQIVANAILSLPDVCREAVTLFYFTGVPQADIAQMLNMTGGAVRTLIYRGRKLLAEKLKEAHYDL